MTLQYVGEYKNRLRDGQGSYSFPGGLFRYAGEWKQGEMNGHGVFSIGDSVYEGEFQNGEIEGTGLRRWPDGSSYSGQFHRGEMHGEGVFLSSSGEKYDGQWRANQRCGTGELIYATGDVFTGEFANHKPHGHGRLVFARSGDAYDGEWQNGEMNGAGVLADHNGDALYEGEWLDGQREGRGCGVLLPVDVSAGALEAAKLVLYTGVWRANRAAGAWCSIPGDVWLRVWADLTVAFCYASEQAERATRLEVKLVGTRTGNSRPSSAATATPDDQRGDEGDERLLELPPTLSIDDKKLPHLVVLSVYDVLDDASADCAVSTTPVVVLGESHRQVRLRVFEGSYDPNAVADQSMVDADTNTLGDDQEAEKAPASSRGQWQFVLLDEPVDSESCTMEDAVALGKELEEQTQAPDPSTAPTGEDAVAARETCVGEVLVENARGKARIQRLGLPAVTLPGTYHIMCESVSPSDSLPPVIINLSIV